MKGGGSDNAKNDWGDGSRSNGNNDANITLLLQPSSKKLVPSELG